MALTGGASHAASGTGTVAISGPAGLRVSFTTIPAFLGSDAGTPREYYGLGRVNVGTSLGYLAHVDIVCSPQLVLGLPAGLTLVAWDFAPGVVASIQELVESAPVVSLQPWDRSPLAVLRQSDARINSPSILTTTWTYTVPAGRQFYVSSARVRVRRSIVATTSDEGTIYIEAGGSMLCHVRYIGNLLGDLGSDQLNGAALILPAGTVLAAKYVCSDTGGQVLFAASMSGFLFDA